jgi:inositol phosphorylceramide mannosyltransferase catalytic subunit
LIPRVLHQVWVGPDLLPEEFARYRETWIHHHPGWEHHLWTEDNLPDGLRRPEVYERLRMPAERSDILRLEVLWRYGGVYVDTDFECHRPLDPLLDQGVEIAVVPLKPGGGLNNAFLAAPPEHPVIDRCLRELRPREFHGYDKWGTGPRFLDALLNDYPEVTRLPAELFYQTSPGQLEDAVATHHAAGSWKTVDSYRRAVKLAEQRNYELRGRIQELEREVESLQQRLARAEDVAPRRHRRFLLR